MKRWTLPWLCSNTYNKLFEKILKVSSIVENDYLIMFLVLDVDQILNAPETQDEGVWKYEHLRQFCMELNGLAVALQV